MQVFVDISKGLGGVVVHGAEGEIVPNTVTLGSEYFQSAVTADVVVAAAAAYDAALAAEARVARTVHPA